MTRNPVSVKRRYDWSAWRSPDLPYLNERFEAGQLAPVIDGPYKLSDAREAFRHFGAGNHKGKIVLTID